MKRMLGEGWRGSLPVVRGSERGREASKMGERSEIFSLQNLLLKFQLGPVLGERVMGGGPTQARNLLFALSHTCESIIQLVRVIDFTVAALPPSPLGASQPLAVFRILTLRIKRTAQQQQTSILTTVCYQPNCAKHFPRAAFPFFFSSFCP